MFAHQVIEDLSTLTHDLPTNIRIKSYIPVIQKSIYKSQKFHIGEMDDIMSLSKSLFGKQMFVDDFPLRMPYNSMWFDYLKKDDGVPERVEGGVYLWQANKRAALVTLLPNEIINIFFFWYQTVRRRWTISNATYYCNIGPKASINERLHIFSNGKLPADYSAGVVPIPNVSDGRFGSISGWQQQIEEDQGDLTTIYTTLKLLNCKNIETEKIRAPEALNKKRRKSGKQEIFDYHVLNVVVPSKKKDYREAITPLSHNRVHLCRGHFKEYTAEHPLFGHYTGLFWWQPHVRGQNKDGIIMKDYKVTAK